MKLIRGLYINLRFFILLGVIVVVFLASYAFNFLFPVAQVILSALLAVLLVDIFILFQKKFRIAAVRVVKSQLSLGDENKVEILLTSRFNLPVKVALIDELPFQFQIRDFKLKTFLKPAQRRRMAYHLRPVKRGEYLFGNINLYISSFIGLVQRRQIVQSRQAVATYPSVIQMKKYELRVFAKTSSDMGIKRIRRLGHNNEFEQIKNYVQGDDIRSINWKATSRKAELMVNQYQDERAQQVYSVIDKSRTMRMPFEGMSLLDYAVNSSLVISNIALKKYDKAGLLTFSDKLGARLKSERHSRQMQRILENLYKQKTQFLEANFELLYYGIRNFVKGRSLILLFTNFESLHSLQRALPLLRRINRQHLLVTIFFENTEIIEAGKKQAENIEDIYFKTFAEKAMMEKRMMAYELRKYGIQTILTTPANLSIDTINKYLELKSRGMI